MTKVLFALAATAAVVSIPASAATTVTYGEINPGGNITLTPAGPGAVSRALSFDVQGDGAFTAFFSFFNPFDGATAGGSATFNYDPDVVAFTSGTISSGGIAVPVNGITGSSIQIDYAGLAPGTQTLSISGILTPSTAPGGNAFARVGGQLTLTGIAAVPEPATWALFILGFGAIGSALRRRSGAVRVSKAKLNFA